MNIEKEALKDLTREQLESMLLREISRQAGMSQRVRDINAEIIRQREEWEKVTTALLKLNNPDRYSADAQREHDWLMALCEAIRPVLGVENIKYGMYDLAYDKRAKPERVAIAKIFLEIMDYFGWDDE